MFRQREDCFQGFFAKETVQKDLDEYEEGQD